MAPAVAGLVGIGTMWAWRERAGWDGRIAMAAMIVLTAVWSAVLLHRNVFGPAWLPWTMIAVAVAAAVAGIALGAHRTVGRCGRRRDVGRRRWADAFSIATAATPHQGSIPTALNEGRHPARRLEGRRGHQSDLAAMLAATHTPWSAATNGSQSAAALEISSGTSVMAIGGWSGDPVPTLDSSSTTCTPARSPTTSRRARGAAGVHDHGEVIYGRNHSAAHTREIADWVAAHYQATSSANPRSTG